MIYLRSHAVSCRAMKNCYSVDYVSSDATLTDPFIQQSIPFVGLLFPGHTSISRVCVCFQWDDNPQFYSSSPSPRLSTPLIPTHPPTVTLPYPRFLIARGPKECCDPPFSHFAAPWKEYIATPLPPDKQTPNSENVRDCSRDPTVGGAQTPLVWNPASRVSGRVEEVSPSTASLTDPPSAGLTPLISICLAVQCAHALSATERTMSACSQTDCTSSALTQGRTQKFRLTEQATVRQAPSYTWLACWLHSLMSYHDRLFATRQTATTSFLGRVKFGDRTFSVAAPEHGTGCQQNSSSCVPRQSSSVPWKLSCSRLPTVGDRTIKLDSVMRHRSSYRRRTKTTAYYFD